ncbi:ParB/RepB/Spo0J family partition protein [Parasedimentitalea marina]|uniref:ParB/RepB/Spo0J family partition protein n=1 Tax=Parasedimentitalea marina TaxID=2483033 RepID=UPI001EE84CC1|nr:hypothetical protein [Parasedimentitalea marina]
MRRDNHGQTQTPDPGAAHLSEQRPESKSALGAPLATAAPIAQVASDAAAQAALSELSAVLETARADGRLIERIALEQIDETHLVRDRLEQDEDEMGALMASLRARGQQTPIELVTLTDRPDGKTHGLISGWRLLCALRRLYEQTSESEFASIKALVIQPETAQDAYVAMVEENEIRVNLSHYERARIAVRALREGLSEPENGAAGIICQCHPCQTLKDWQLYRPGRGAGCGTDVSGGDQRKAGTGAGARNHP